MIYQRIEKSECMACVGAGHTLHFGFDLPHGLSCVGFVVKGVKPSMVKGLDLFINGLVVLSFSGSWSDEAGREVSAGELIIAHAELMGAADPMGRMVVMLSGAPGLFVKIRPGSGNVHAARVKLVVNGAAEGEVVRVLVDFLVELP